MNAIAEVFPHVQVVRRPGSSNWIVLALTADAAPTAEALRSRAEALDALGTWKISFTELAAVTLPWERRPSP
ncbi:hypothetical protein [Nannocystis pusilla]|uniref:hypothetical protein n=1 Tax=Nannocystis pusilla TaxID=889268 RepID=UPI003B8104D8